MSLILERKDSKAKAPNFMIFGSSGFEKKLLSSKLNQIELVYVK
jgi:hypothetical protein